MRTKIIKEALKAAAEPVRAEASRLAPVATGKLSEHIIIKPGKQNTVLVGPDSDAFYGLFQELGTSRHAAQPFLRPALDAKKDEANRIAGEVIGREIEAVAR